MIESLLLLVTAKYSFLGLAPEEMPALALCPGETYLLECFNRVIELRVFLKHWPYNLLHFLNERADVPSRRHTSLSSPSVITLAAATFCYFL